ncbi:Na+/H+ antiporter NhaC family protein, partial [Arthrospira platensis SPKY1]|nr:Na+/H+ antiporter NhaC family protein [Arthrospira platensis SPKY1]
KLSPLSDTTNLAPAMAGTDLFTHIRYMLYTTVPSVVIALLIFTAIGMFQTPIGAADIQNTLSDIQEVFYISPWLFAVPALVLLMIIRKTEPLIALLAGTLLG